MKALFVSITFSLSLSAIANIEFTPEDPNDHEIVESRMCFNEIEKLGCKLPRENQKDFRSCMSQNFSSLSSVCQKMMIKLYK